MKKTIDLEQSEATDQAQQAGSEPFALVDNVFELPAIRLQADQNAEPRLTQTACGIWLDENEEEPWLEF